jgi:septum site-determining protein MinD
MGQIISIHSFRGGTGKSNLTANIATMAAAEGHRVGIVDTDIQSPGIHVLFGFDESNMDVSLNDYLWGKIPIEKAAYPVHEMVGPEHDFLRKSKLWLIPSSIRTGEIARILREGYDVGMLNDGFHNLMEKLNLDFLFIDTHPGLNDETLLSIAISNALIIILRPDSQDFQGTAVTVDVARKLEVPKLRLVVNKALSNVYDVNKLRDEISQIYNAKVSAVLPLSEDVAFNASKTVFSAVHPDHPWTQAVRQVARDITSKDK